MTPARRAERRIYENPVIPGFHPDPSVCRVGDDYYLATSTFEYFPGVPLFHSRDLVSWRQIGHALTRAGQLCLANAKSSQGIFAPTLRHHAGRFYLVTTNIGGGGNFYVTASDPAGPWSDPIWIEETSWGMDPSFWFDDDGKVYYTRHGGGERGGIYQAEIDLGTGKLAAQPREIWAGTGGVWPEGPHLYKIGGTYYLLIAEGGTGYEHAITIARSSSPWGPFEAFERNPILSHRGRSGHPIQATGHGDLVQAKDGSYWLVLLGIRPWDGKHHHLGRETFLAPVTWNAEGWPVVNANRGVELLMDGSALPGASEAKLELAARDDFDSGELGLEYAFVRNPDASSWSLVARPGWLRLAATATTLDGVGSPAFVARRQRHFRCEASALLEFAPAEPGHEAGLALRASEDNHYEVFVTARGGQRLACVRTRIQGKSELLAEIDVAEGPLVLGVRATPEAYAFWVGAPGTEPLVIANASTIPLSTEAAGGFTGVFVGMYAAAAASGASVPDADFDWFEYRPLGD